MKLTQKEKEHIQENADWREPGTFGELHGIRHQLVVWRRKEGEEGWKSRLVQITKGKMCNTKDGAHSQVLEGGSDMASFMFRKITLLRVWLMM